MVAVVKQMDADRWIVVRQDMPSPGMMHWSQVLCPTRDKEEAATFARRLNVREYNRQAQNSPVVLRMILQARLRVEMRLMEKRQGR